MSTLTVREILPNFTLSTFIGKATEILFSNCNWNLLSSGLVRDRNIGPGINHKQMAKCFVCGTGGWTQGPVWTNQALYHYFGDKITSFLLIWVSLKWEPYELLWGEQRPREAVLGLLMSIGEERFWVRRWVWVFGPLLGFQMPSYI